MVAELDRLPWSLPRRAFACHEFEPNEQERRVRLEGGSCISLAKTPTLAGLGIPRSGGAVRDRSALSEAADCEKFASEPGAIRRERAARRDLAREDEHYAGMS
jgi:hypothetical protein